MDKNKLINLIDQGLSTREISVETGKSQTNIRYWLKNFDLKTKINKFNKGASGPLLCPECGATNPDDFYLPKRRCKKCHNKLQNELTRLQKQKAVNYKGGKCEKCGYCRNYAGLDFHHLDPSKKDPKWRTARNWGWERMKEELDKCICVCKTCHMEIHYPECNIQSE